MTKFSNSGQHHEFSKYSAKPEKQTSHSEKQRNDSDKIRSTKRRTGSSGCIPSDPTQTNYHSKINQYRHAPPLPSPRYRTENYRPIRYNQYDHYNNYNNYDRTTVKKSGFLTQFGAIIVLIILAYMIMTIVNGKNENNYNDYQNPAYTQTLNIPDNTKKTEINGYVLKKNTLLEAYVVPMNAGNDHQNLKIKAYHDNSATDTIDMRNTHFYDVCDLIRNQNADPDHGIYEIEYVGVGDSDNDTEYVDIIYFVLDKNLILDIKDGRISYSNLYEYAIDLWLHDALK